MKNKSTLSFSFSLVHRATLKDAFLLLLNFTQLSPLNYKSVCSHDIPSAYFKTHCPVLKASSFSSSKFVTSFFVLKAYSEICCFMF